VAQNTAALADAAVKAEGQACVGLSHPRTAGTIAPRKKSVERILLMPGIQLRKRVWFERDKRADVYAQKNDRLQMERRAGSEILVL
jgi:hypothetical protein